MMIKSVRFNIYLAAALCALLVAGGCKSPEEKKKAAEKKQLTLLSLHLEVSPDGTERNESVPVYRPKPVYVNVEKDPFLDERYVDGALVVDTLGGFAIQLKFNWQGTGILDGTTTDNHNRRVAILAKFDKEERWLGAPILRKRISDGVFAFTPDCSREEAERIVRGLNNVAREMNKDDKL